VQPGLEIAVIFAVIAAAAAVQAVTAFGFALLAVPLLAVISDVPTAVVGVGVAGVLLNFGTVRVDWAHVRWRPVGGLLVAAAAGMPFGLIALRGLADRALGIVVAGAVLGCTLLVWLRPRLRGGWPVVAAAGVVAGVLATATGTNGPPLVAVFLGLGFRPAEVRASLAAYFSVSGVLSLVGFGLAGELTRPVWVIGAVGVLAAPLGWWLGNRVFRRFDAARFRRVVLGMLVCTSLMTLVRAVMA
jgi:uncharacterized protein